MNHKPQTTNHKPQTTNHKPQTTFTSLIDWIEKRSFKSVFLVLLSGTWLATATAQVQFPVVQPTPKVGEIAKYRTVDLWNNTELSTFQNELVEITDANLVLRNISSTNPVPRTLRFDRSGNPCRTLRNSDKAVCAGTLSFPIAVGNKHEYKELPFPNGNGHSSATCQVKGEEKVTVAGGTFDTVRIECAGFWTQVFDGSFRGKQTETLWYAPAIGRLVKWQFFNFRGDGSPFTKNQNELVEFIPAK